MNESILSIDWLESDKDAKVKIINYWKLTKKLQSVSRGSDDLLVGKACCLTSVDTEKKSFIAVKRAYFWLLEYLTLLKYHSS